MAEPAVRHTSSGVTDQSIGDLVSVAARDISQLIRYEVDLARVELKADLKRAVMGAALLGIAAFTCCLLLMLLCFAFAFGLAAISVPGGLWGAFLFVAAACFLLIALAAALALLIVRKLRKSGGMKKTRRSLADSKSLLHRGHADGAGTEAAARAG
jgi:uncharacterized membrane protein YqjE